MTKFLPCLIVCFSACASAPMAPTECVRSAVTPLPALVGAADKLPSLRSPSGTALATELARGHNAYLALMRLDAGAMIPAHQDESEEYLYVLEGGGAITIDGVVSTIAPGTAVFMPSMATVSFENGPAKSVIVQVFADPRSAAKYKAWQPVTGP